MSSDSPLIEIIPLANTPVEAGCIAPHTIDIITKQRALGKKSLLFYNRRGTARAWICEDCGHFSKCPNCDIAMTYHTTPNRVLMCHHCNFIDTAPIECPHCHGNHFLPIGAGIEQIKQVLEKALPPETRILIVDSDHRTSLKDPKYALETHDVILSTQIGMFLDHTDIGAIIMLLFEIDLSLPEYDIEEALYAQIAYHKKRHIPLYIQTYIPEHPLLQAVVFENYRTYIQTLASERKKFAYPPYADFVTLHISHTDREAVFRLRDGILERMKPLLSRDIFCAWDRDIIERIRGEYTQKIILKGRGVTDILDALKSIIVRSRFISVEWH